MRVSLIPVLLLVALPGAALAQKKEFVELGRDLALLQEEVRSNAKQQNERLANIESILKAMQDQLASSSRAVAVLDSSLRDRIEKQVSGPMSGVGSKVDTLSQDFGYVKETVNEINTKMGRLQQKVVDLENTIKMMQAPPAPPAGATQAAPSANLPPAGATAKGVFEDAMRDKSAGRFDLAVKGFTDYVSWYKDTDAAADAQYYIGECLYNEKNYDAAIPALDQFLDAYPKNSRAMYAHLMKGRSLAKLGQPSDAEKEFRTILSQAPNSDAAPRARQELKDLGLSTSTKAPARRR